MKSYSLDDFARVPSAKEIVTDKVDLGSLPAVSDVQAQARWTAPMLELFGQPKEYFDPAPDGAKQDRSAALMNLAHSGAELGWEDSQIAAVLYDADERWGKYLHRRDRDKRLIDFVNRARAKHGYSGPVQIDLSRFMKEADTVDPEKSNEPLVFGFNDFVEADYPIDWTFEHLLAQGGLGLLTGFPGTGKTQLAISLAAHAALGRDKWLKWENSGGSKKVLFLSLEMGKAPLNLFMKTIATGYSDLRTLNRNLLVAPFGESLPLDIPAGQAFLNNLLDEYMPDIVVIDSLQTVISKEMTDELAVKDFFKYLKIVRQKYKCSMVIVHHNRKKSNNAQQKHDVEQSDIYGSTFIVAEVDFVVSIRKQDPSNDSLLAIDMLKNRLGKTIPPFDVYRDKTLGFSIDFENLMENFGKEHVRTMDV
jgi:KaiC/GvpD/RAD55 family RecA-like ATPase